MMIRLDRPQRAAAQICDLLAKLRQAALYCTMVEMLGPRVDSLAGWPELTLIMKRNHAFYNGLDKIAVGMRFLKNDSRFT